MYLPQRIKLQKSTEWYKYKTLNILQPCKVCDIDDNVKDIIKQVGNEHGYSEYNVHISCDEVDCYYDIIYN